jgi:hypothetical protein
MAADYVVGAVVRISDHITEAGVDTDPTTETIRVTKPSGAQTTYTYAGTTVTKDSPGHYHVDVTLDRAGEWVLYAVSTGPGAGSARAVITVDAEL